MHKSSFRSLWSLTVLATVICLSATASSDVTTVPFSLTFRDSEIGVKVTPSHVLIDGLDFCDRIDADGNLSIDMTLGDHPLIAKADAYQTIPTHLTALIGGSSEYVINLDPLQRTPELQEAYLGAALKAATSNEILVAGFVVDGISALPVPDASIVLIGTSATCTTNSRGYYRLAIDLATLPLPNDTTSHTEATLKLTRTGYSEQYYDHLRITGELVQFLNFRLFKNVAATPETPEPPRIVDNYRPTSNCESCGKSEDTPIEEFSPPQAKSIQSLPSSVRVGRGAYSSTSIGLCTGYYQKCTGVLNNCAGPVDVVSLDTYVGKVMKSEIGFGVMVSEPYIEQFRANAIAIRTYAAYYSYHNAGTSYDICNSDYCQCYNTDASVGPMMSEAVSDTLGMYYSNSSGTIVKSEFSAFGDDQKNCGQYYIVHYDVSCKTDDVLLAHIADYQVIGSHGRGLSQWGSYWRAQRGDSYQEILSFYYGDYGYVLQGSKVSPGPPAGCFGGIAGNTSFGSPTGKNGDMVLLLSMGATLFLVGSRRQRHLSLQYSAYLCLCRQALDSRHIPGHIYS